MFTTRDLLLYKDAIRRSEAYRIKLVKTLEKRPDIPAEEALDRLSQAYALTGNLEYNLINAVKELEFLKDIGKLPDPQ